jgi:HTH-type transcriptional regulator/antitoxin HigA
LSKKEVASRLDISEKHLIDVVKGEVAITPPLALKLEYVFGISAKTRLQLDTTYQASKAREAEKQILEEEKSLYDLFCAKNIKIIVQYGYMTLCKTTEDKIREVKRFMGVSALSSIETLYRSEKYYRKSEKFDLFKLALGLRFRLGEKEADKQTVTDFTKGNIRPLVAKLQALLSDASPDIEQVKSLCNQYGIYFVFIPESFEKVPVKGVVRYYKENPLIQLSNKGNRTDVFRFNLFHEIGHIAYHLGKKETFLDIEGNAISDKEEEQEADQFALEAILADSEYTKVRRNPTEENLVLVAKKNKIHQ